MKHLGKETIPEVDQTRLHDFQGVPGAPASGSVGTAQIYYDVVRQQFMAIVEGGEPQPLGGGGTNVLAYLGL
jgi:hypothetical protein